MVYGTDYRPNEIPCRNPRTLATPALRARQFTTTCPPTFAQDAAVAALQDTARDRDRSAKNSPERRVTALELLAQQDVLHTSNDGGAFYLYLTYPKRLGSADDLALRLLEQEHVALVPGTAFDPTGNGDRSLRVSYASSLDDVREGLSRLIRLAAMVAWPVRNSHPRGGDLLSNEYSRAVAEAIWASDVKRVGYIPSVTVAPVIHELVALDGGSDGVSPRVTPLSREEEAVGVMGAVSLGGDLAAVVMQDNGFGNALTALTTFSLSYHLPLLIFANTRGSLGEYNSMIHSISAPVPRVLEATNLPYVELDRRSAPEDWRAVVEEAAVHAVMTFRPVIVLAAFWNTDGEVA
ncbi:aminotransferase class I/II-fold pyridoxal phosphate-dependent enzyme [Microbacterium rhizosphaerae]|uniref:Aminotransferase class I/II-fold pyridoxal phosphate-dependent enzyme n=2 Tax=Microbacterium rhizosphaerae TaxID=1678237 RepID=A0ABZ0SJW0_9MICO|nr:aminotransferase class I/II-fold pyridoxal phosphate-dependent enzyme [Microbacterium rhizosphaerae]WPR89682.1 aminotransferase class I/II-fold pyridoxal phosphate-dependent enzyme [Microbacterium rhizosphaerae]